MLILLPNLLGLSAGLRVQKEEASRAAALAVKERDAVMRVRDDMGPVLQYAARLEASRANRRQWLGTLRLLEEGVGPTGFVTSVSMRSVAGGFDVVVSGEAPALSSVNNWVAGLRLRPECRELRLATVQPAEWLGDSSGAVRYEVRGKVKVR